MSILHMIFGILGAIVSSFLSLHPLPMFFRHYKNKRTDRYEPLLHLAMMLKCGVWILYGSLHFHSIYIIIAESVGFFAELACLVMFFWFCWNDNEAKALKERVCVLCPYLLLVLIYGVLAAVYLLSEFVAHLVVGVLGIVISISAYLYLFFRVTRLNNKFSVKWSVFYLVENVLWLVLGALHEIDIYVLIISCIGAISCAVDLLVVLLRLGFNIGQPVTAGARV